MAQDKDTTAAAKDAAKRATTQTAEVGRNATAEAAGTARLAAERQADIAEKAAETMRGAAESNIAAFARMTEDSVDRFAKLFGLDGNRMGALSQATSGNLDAIVRSTSVLAEGYQSICQEWLDFAQRSARRNMEGMSTLMGCRTPQDFAAAQSDLFRSRVQDLLDSTVRVSEISAKTADNAVKRIAADTAEDNRPRRKA